MTLTISRGTLKFSKDEEKTLISAAAILCSAMESIPEEAILMDKGTGEIHMAAELHPACELLKFLSWNGKTYWSDDGKGFDFFSEEEKDSL